VPAALAPLRHWRKTFVELEGTIGTFSLRELIEMIVYSSVAGVLEVGEGTSAVLSRRSAV
jgi:hypothetical protein